MSLIGTGDIRTWMGITDGDKRPNAKLDLIKDAVLDFVDSFTCRKLEAARYTTNVDYSYYDGMGLPYIYLSQYPVSYVFSAAVDADRVFGSGTAISTADLFWYPSGKLVSEGGYFSRGRRNVYIDFIAGYAPVVGGTHNAVVSSYPLPNDLKQVMLEMSVESFKEGITAVHTIQAGVEQEPKFIQMLSRNSFWRNVLIKYKAFDMPLHWAEE
jgi:hypothetical protein